ncbi:MAG: 50S ribosomal protein L25 [Nitrospirota bacterium]|jgi:large subunit ribosomal protein L25
MERQTLKAEIRKHTGKGAARSMRRAGNIPAVVYRENKATPLMLDAKELYKFIRDTSGDQVLVNLKFDGDVKLALLKEFQMDPVAGDLLHADFFEVSMQEKVRVAVHVTTVGEPIGVKKDKGILQYGLREIDVECLPGDIPGHVEMDISGLEIGSSLHVMDADLPRSVTLLTDPEEMLVTVMAPKLEEEVVAEEEAVEEGAEPEVMEKGKKEEEAEEKKEEA